jgi:uncharacterized protein
VTNQKYNVLPESICLQCGFCCNGVIFADLQLNEQEDTAHLLALGLRLASGRGKKLRQPCGAFCEGRCRIYDERPDSCRRFDCALLRRLKEGEVGAEKALRTIRQGRQLVDEVFKLLCALGDAHESKPLAARLRQTTRRVEGMNLDGETASLYGQLTVAVQKLQCVLSASFYPGC